MNTKINFYLSTPAKTSRRSLLSIHNVEFKTVVDDRVMGAKPIPTAIVPIIILYPNAMPTIRYVII